MSKLISVDEFRAHARADAKFSATVQRLATGAATEVVGADRTLRFCFSDASIDRAGDSIDVEGWDLEPFEKNPVALWAHDSSAPPIGRADSVGVVGKRLMGDIEFAPVETYAFADTIYRLAKDKFINAVSVGFIPREWNFTNDKDRGFGIDFTKQELVEISVCPVPCNANALAEARAKGIDTGPLREWAEKILDGGGGSILVPRSVLEDIFRDARTPHAARAKYRALIEEKSMNWKCSAARDLPIDEDSAWDGPAAEKAIFDHCGFDGDKPNTALAAQAFLFHDASAADKRGSYKEPFATIKDGKMVAIAAGVRAAASRLSATEGPSSEVKSEAEGVIKHYESRFKKAKAVGESNGASAIVGANCGRERDDECGMKDPAECAIHAPKGDCGRDADETCGMSDPMECATHYTTAKQLKTLKAGRRISAENKARLEKALEHHANAQEQHDLAAKCIKDVLDSNEPEPAPAPTAQQGDGPEVLDTPKTVEERLAQTRKLLAEIEH